MLRKNPIPLVATLIFAAIIFFARYGWGMLDPTNIKWLMTDGSDWTPDFLAWTYYRNEPWGLPLGVMEGYSAPGKVSIGLTGAIPLMAVPFKILSSILPFEFQYFGFWMFLCFLLQGYFSAKLVHIFVKESLPLFLGAALMTLSYSMMDRVGHLNLCAHWLVIAGIYVFFKHRERSAFWRHGLLIAMSVWIHPYLIVFCLAIAFAHYLSMVLEDRSSLKRALGYMLGNFLFLFGAWFLIGNHVLSSGDSVSSGLGIYSTNLNTFWNPKLPSTFLPHQGYAFDGQYEGLAYLGIGVLLALLIVAGLRITGKTNFKYRNRTRALLLVALLLFVFSLSHVITYGSHVLFEIPLPKFIIIVASSLRATGRYVWLLQYILVLGMIIGLYRASIHTNIKSLVLAGALILNVWDFSSYLQTVAFVSPDWKIFNGFEAPFWDDVIGTSETLVMYPPHSRTYNRFGDETYFILLASKYDRDINTGHLARYNNKLRRKYLTELQDQLAHKPSDLKETTLISTKKELVSLYPLWSAGNHEVIGKDNFIAFIPKSQKELLQRIKKRAKASYLDRQPQKLGEFLALNEQNTILIAARDDAATSLPYCTEGIVWFNKAQSALKSLVYRDGYVGVFQNGKLLEEHFGKDMDGKPNLHVKLNGRQIDIASAGNAHGNSSSIKIDSEEKGLNERGLNIVVLDSKMNILESTSFDTYEKCYRLVEMEDAGYSLWKVD